MKIVSGYWASKTIMVALDLDVFTELAKSPLTTKELAKRIDCDARGLARILSALSGLGLLEISGESFTPSSTAKTFLDKNSPQYHGAIIQHHNDLWKSWNNLGDIVKNGTSNNFLTGIKKDPQQIRHFIWGMHHAGLEVAESLAASFDDYKITKMLDVGGCGGTFAMALARRHPDMKADVFDLPHILEHTREIVHHYNMEEQIGTVTGDFNDLDLPGGYDFVLLSKVTHIESPPNNQGLLKKVFRALEPGGTVTIHDFFVTPERDGPLFSTLFSLNMLVRTPGGDVYSVEEYTTWLKEAGFTDIAHQDLKGPTGFITARKN